MTLSWIIHYFLLLRLDEHHVVSIIIIETCKQVCIEKFWIDYLPFELPLERTTCISIEIYVGFLRRTFTPSFSFLLFFVYIQVNPKTRTKKIRSSRLVRKLMEKTEYSFIRRRIRNRFLTVLLTRCESFLEVSIRSVPHSFFFQRMSPIKNSSSCSCLTIRKSTNDSIRWILHTLRVSSNEQILIVR